MSENSLNPMQRSATKPDLTPAPVASAAQELAVPPLEAEKQAHPAFRALIRFSNVLLLLAIVGALYCTASEYSTQRYVDAFSDAIVPVTGSPQQKIQSILDWMAHPPARFTTGIVGTPNDRNPIDTLNYKALLQVCGTATNAFINLADTSDLSARRLLLLGPDGRTRHVDAEVWINGRWFVVDPTFRVILRGADGKMLTRRELANPAVFAAATRDIPQYDPSYNFEHTTHIRIAAVPLIGKPAGRVLDSLLPGWQDSALISLIVERESLLILDVVLVVALVLLAFRLVLYWFGAARLGIHSAPVSSRLRCAYRAFLHPTN